MPADNLLAADEQRRISQFENIRSTARDEIQSRAEEQAADLSSTQEHQVASLGEEFKEKSISEIRETESEVTRTRGLARISQIIDYVFYLIYGLITLQIFFDLLGANRTNGFRSFIDLLTTPLLAPFNNLFPDIAAGRFHLRLSYITALVLYLFFHLALTGILRLLGQRKTEI